MLTLIILPVTSIGQAVKLGRQLGRKQGLEGYVEGIKVEPKVIQEFKHSKLTGLPNNFGYIK